MENEEHSRNTVFFFARFLKVCYHINNYVKHAGGLSDEADKTFRTIGIQSTAR